MRKVEVVPHDPTWKDAFETEAKQVEAALGDNVIAVHHIGSTSITGIYAKPIIDLLVEVQYILQVNDQEPSMQRIGYESMGEYGIPGRRYFRKNNTAGIRTHHVHVFRTASDQVIRHLAFRDYMLAHPTAAQVYSDLKRRLAKKYPTDIESYMDGKDEFIQETDKKAAQWRLASHANPLFTIVSD